MRSIVGFLPGAITPARNREARFHKEICLRSNPDPYGTPVSMESMDIHGFHGYPWIPWISMESMDIHGIHGYPWIPWKQVFHKDLDWTVSKFPYGNGLHDFWRELWPQVRTPLCCACLGNEFTRVQICLKNVFKSKG